MSESSTLDTPNVEETTDSAASAPDLTTEDGIRLAVANAGDARIEDLPAFLTRLQGLRDTVGSAVREAVRALNARKHAAKENAEIRRYILLPDGPDWAGSTTVYKSIVSATMDSVFSGNANLTTADRNRELSAIKQHVNRVFLEPAIRAYVRETQQGMPSADEADTDAFKHRVKMEYRRCGITPPKGYLSAEEIAANATGGGPGGATTPAEAAVHAIDGLAAFSPKMQALSLLKAASILAEAVSNPKEGNVPDRADVQALVLRTQSVLNFSRKALDGKASPADVEEIKQHLWTPQDSRA